MKHLPGLMLVMLCLASLLITACARPPVATASGEKPAKLEKQGAGQPAKVILTELAAKRIGLKTTPAAADAQKTAIPYAAVVYDNQGKTWAYTEAEALAFIRQPITIERVDGDRAILTVGPPSGALVVTVGVAELYGAETEFAK